jgi:hypothetical protein
MDVSVPRFRLVDFVPDRFVVIGYVNASDGLFRRAGRVGGARPRVVAMAELHLT